MKKPLLSVLALMAAIVSAGAQVVEVASVQPVAVANNLQVDRACISPDGTFAIVSDLESTALSRVDLTTGSVAKISDNGSALKLQFSPDGRAVVFSAATVAPDHRRFYSVEGVDLALGTTRHLAAPARHGANFAISPKGALSIAGANGLSTHSVSGEATSLAPTTVVGINRGHLEVTTPDGVTRNIDPQGKGSYLWPSLSPDGTRIAYYLVHKGCYVCNLDGSNPVHMGYLQSAKWLNDEVLVACQTEDDGTQITFSPIVAADLKGNIQTIADGTLLGLSPTASADGKTVAFGTVDGKLYIINLR